VLKTHNKKDDAWTAINGKIYNITPYLSFHPGGEKELMRVAGRDGTKLFGEITYALAFRSICSTRCRSSHPCLG
jgi:cytochrome b involved in lipid metabolism